MNSSSYPFSSLLGPKIPTIDQSLNSGKEKAHVSEKQTSLPPIPKESLSLIENILTNEQTLLSQGNVVATYSIHTILFHLLKNHRLLNTLQLEIVGSFVPVILGKPYIESMAGETREGFSLPEPNDLDIRILQEGASLNDLILLQTSLLQSISLSTHLPFDSVLKMITKQKIVHDEENLFLILALGKVEFIFVSKLKRDHLFNKDSLRLTLLCRLDPLGFRIHYPQFPTLSSTIQNSKKPFQDILRKNLSSTHPEKIHHFGLARFIEYLSLGFTCDDPALFSALSSTYIGIQPFCHAANYILREKKEDRPAQKAAFALNAFIHMETVLDFKTLKIIWSELYDPSYQAFGLQKDETPDSLLLWLALTAKKALLEGKGVISTHLQSSNAAFCLVEDTSSLILLPLRHLDRVIERAKEELNQKGQRRNLAYHLLTRLQKVEGTCLRECLEFYETMVHENKECALWMNHIKSIKDQRPLILSLLSHPLDHVRGHVEWLFKKNVESEKKTVAHPIVKAFLRSKRLLIDSFIPYLTYQEIESLSKEAVLQKELTCSALQLLEEYALLGKMKDKETKAKAFFALLPYSPQVACVLVTKESRKELIEAFIKQGFTLENPLFKKQLILHFEEKNTPSKIMEAFFQKCLSKGVGDDLYLLFYSEPLFSSLSNPLRESLLQKTKECAPALSKTLSPHDLVELISKHQSAFFLSRKLLKKVLSHASSWFCPKKREVFTTLLESAKASLKTDDLLLLFTDLAEKNVAQSQVKQVFEPYFKEKGSTHLSRTTSSTIYQILRLFSLPHSSYASFFLKGYKEDPERFKTFLDQFQQSIPFLTKKELTEAYDLFFKNKETRGLFALIDSKTEDFSQSSLEDASDLFKREGNKSAERRCLAHLLTRDDTLQNKKSSYSARCLEILPDDPVEKACFIVDHVSFINFPETLSESLLIEDVSALLHSLPVSKVFSLLSHFPTIQGRCLPNLMKTIGMEKDKELVEKALSALFDQTVTRSERLLALSFSSLLKSLCSICSPLGNEFVMAKRALPQFSDPEAVETMIDLHFFLMEQITRSTPDAMRAIERHEMVFKDTEIIHFAKRWEEAQPKIIDCFSSSNNKEIFQRTLRRFNLYLCFETMRPKTVEALFQKLTRSYKRYFFKHPELLYSTIQEMKKAQFNALVLKCLAPCERLEASLLSVGTELIFHESDQSQGVTNEQLGDAFFTLFSNILELGKKGRVDDLLFMNTYNLLGDKRLRTYLSKENTWKIFRPLLSTYIKKDLSNGTISELKVHIMFILDQLPNFTRHQGLVDECISQLTFICCRLSELKDFELLTSTMTCLLTAGKRPDYFSYIVSQLVYFGFSKKEGLKYLLQFLWGLLEIFYPSQEEAKLQLSMIRCCFEQIIKTKEMNDDPFLELLQKFMTIPYLFRVDHIEQTQEIANMIFQSPRAQKLAKSHPVEYTKLVLLTPHSPVAENLSPAEISQVLEETLLFLYSLNFAGSFYYMTRMLFITHLLTDDLALVEKFFMKTLEKGAILGDRLFPYVDLLPALKGALLPTGKVVFSAPEVPQGKDIAASFMYVLLQLCLKDPLFPVPVRGRNQSILEFSTKSFFELIRAEGFSKAPENMPPIFSTCIDLWSPQKQNDAIGLTIFLSFQYVFKEALNEKTHQALVCIALKFIEKAHAFDKVLGEKYEARFTPFLTPND